MIAKDIVKEIKDIGVCRPWYLQMKKEPTLKNLSKKYFEGSDWALENNFPSYDILTKYKGVYEEYGIYFKEIVSVAQSDMALFDCEANLHLKNYAVSNIIIRGTSQVDLHVKDHAIVYVTILDEAVLNVTITDNAQVKVYRYGGQVNGVEVNERKWEE